MRSDPPAVASPSCSFRGLRRTRERSRCPAEVGPGRTWTRGRLADLRGLLGRNPTEARKALETVFDGPLTFTPVEGGRSYRIEGAAAVGAMFTTVSDPTGTR